MNKKSVIISMAIGITILVGGFVFMNVDKSKNEVNVNVPSKVEKPTPSSKQSKTIEFLRTVHGLKIESVELIDNPVGFKGEFLAPKESIRNGVDYFLKESKNDKIDKVNIDIGNGYIKANLNYKITNKITTPIEVKIIPSLNNNKDLILKIDDVKFLDLNIAKWIVDIGVKNFVKDLFPKESGMIVEFSEGNVLINKNNFKGVLLNNISIDSKALKIDMIIDLENWL